MRWLLVPALLALSCAALAQQAPATAAGEGGAAQEKMLTFDFAGGDVAALAGALESTLEQRVVARRAYERTLPAFKIPGPLPEGGELGGMGNMGNMMLGQIPTVAGLGQASAEGVSQERLIALLTPYGRVGLRPGWRIEPKPAEGAAVVEPRKAIEKRDGEIVPFVRFDAITATDLADQLVKHGRLPILFDDAVVLPEEAFPVDLQEVTMQAVITSLAERLGAQATPVWIAYDLTTDLQEYLEAVTDDEIQDIAQLLAFWDQLTPEQRQNLIAMMFGQFNQLPTDQRQTMLAAMQYVMQGMAGRIGTMDPGAADQLRGAMQGLYGDMSTFYGGLNPGQRSELSGVFGAFGQMMGGRGGGGRGARPGM